MPSIETTLQNLEPLSRRINTASNELTHALEQIELRLNTLRIGVEVWADTPISTSDYRSETNVDGDPTGARSYQMIELGYGRLANGWGLILRTRTFVETPIGNGLYDTDVYTGEIAEPTALSGAPRTTRIKAVAILPELLQMIEREGNAVIEQVEAGKKIADSLR